MRSNRTEPEPLFSKCGRTEPNSNRCFQNAVEPNRTRTAAFKMRSNRTEPEPLFSKCGRTEPNSNRCFQNAIEPNRTRTAVCKMRSNRTKPNSNHVFQNKVEPNSNRCFQNAIELNRTEPNSNLCFQNAVEPNRIRTAVFKMRSNRTELEPLFSKCAHVSPCVIGARTSRWYVLMPEMSQRTYAHLYVPICHVRCA